MKLEGKVAVVTGGATGMGRAVCELFAAQGARVAVNYSSSGAAAEELVQAVADAGGEAFAIQANVADESQVRRLVQRVDERWGRLDVLVNNAGWSQVTPHADLDALTDEIWDRTLNVNLRGAFYAVRQALTVMKRHGGGVVVNNASASAWHAAGSSVVYSASKAAMVSMTKSLARALAPEVRVVGLAPGMVDTGFADWPKESVNRSRDTTPLQRIATAEDVAKTALFLVENESITAETIVIDGGRTRLGPRDYR